MSVNGEGIGGARICTLTIVARAGEPEWSDLKSELRIEGEDGWPKEVVMAAAMGALRQAMAAVQQAQVAQSAPGKAEAEGEDG